jgi:hypothetical protein
MSTVHAPGCIEHALHHNKTPLVRCTTACTLFCDAFSFVAINQAGDGVLLSAPVDWLVG